MVQAIATLLVIAVAAMTTAPVSTPLDVVQASVGEVIATLAREDTAGYVRGAERGRRADGEPARLEIRRIAGGVVAFDEMARRSLSRHWAARTPDEQTEFVDLFTNLLERTYLDRIRSHAGDTIAYLGESIDGPLATVKSKVVTGRGAETVLDYSLLLKNGQWKVYDVLVDGVSFVSTYRSEFDGVIRASSYGALVDQLRARSATPLTSPGRAAS